MRILYVTQYFPPEIGAGASRAKEMVRYLSGGCHRVTVLTAFPNYLTGVVPPAYKNKLVVREWFGEAAVVRVWTSTYRHRSITWRLLNYVTFMLMATFIGLADDRKYDIVYASSPSPFVCLAGWMVAFWKAKRFVFEARDIWPKAAVMAGQLKNRYAVMLGQALENFCYARASLIVAVTKGLYDDLLERGFPKSKMCLIANGVNVNLYRPERDTNMRRQIGYDGRDFVIVYAGVLGHIHAPSVILRAAQLLSSNETIKFLLIGEGVKKNELMREVDAKGIKNVTFVPGLPEEKLSVYVASSDAGLATVRKGKFFEIFVPVKMFTYMACALPVVLAARGEAEGILNKARGGVVVDPEDPEELVDAILALRDNRDLAREMGKRGREFVVKHYSRKGQAKKLEASLLKLLSYGTKRN
ncbi:glycosyltransferase WbuB [candidate division TA06 bacterium]|uniref:Glycosyltransferase WbuB n=1 Tax=candidate division TA06 bacterium TaxID=2250710 RepID=A0A523XM95_UNCT6|nr:MAG: glycosyltransferase WbuB [candidate division TA06 bacterium]